MRIRPWAWLLLGVISSAVLAGAISPVPPVAETKPTAPVAAPMDAAKWVEILGALADADYAKREAGQKELDTLDWRSVPFLKQATEGVADPEIKARLTARLAAIEEETAVNPPPVSLSLKNASFVEVCEALSKTLGIKLDPYPNGAALNGNGFNGISYTLEANDKPFWEVFMALSKQRGLTFVNSGSGTMLSSNSGAGFSMGVVTGPLAVMPLSLTRQRSINFQNPNPNQINPSNEMMSLTCSLLLDPRVRVVKYATPTLTEVRDNAGNILLSQPANQTPTSDGSSMAARLTQMSFGASLRIPEKPGDRLASIKGAWRVLVQVADDHVDITDLDKKVGQVIEFAGYTLRLRSFNMEANGNQGQVSVNLYLNNEGGNRVAADGSGPATFNVSILDATGKVVATNVARGTASISASGALALPLRVRLAAPAKTKELSLPFELKDLPMP